MSSGTNESLISQIIRFLSERKILSWFLVIVYTLFILFFHKEIATEAVKIKNNLGTELFNRRVSLIGFGVLFIYMIFSSVALYNDKQRNRKAGYLFITLLLIVLHALFLFELNIEIIHALEFGILSFLLFPITRRFGAAIIYTLPVIFIDEWLQYQIWYPGYVEYFEFNDILLDIMGCGLMMVTLRMAGVKIQNTYVPFFKKTETWFLATLVILIGFAMVTCFLAPYKNGACAHTILVLNHLDNPENFWQIHPVHQAKYHVMSPTQGLLFITLLCLFFMGLDKKERADN